MGSGRSSASLWPSLPPARSARGRRGSAHPSGRWRPHSSGVKSVVCEAADRLAEQVGSVVVGKRQAVDQLLAALLVEGHVLLDDEINRATPRAQSSLLEAMQERQVTVDETTHRLPDPFFVIATQNPVELEGTFPLPEAQLDRFLFLLSLGYPDADDEDTILRIHGPATVRTETLDPLFD